MPKHTKKDDVDKLVPPRAMVKAARVFITAYLHGVRTANEDAVDEAVDRALFAWKGWTGKAFNVALDEVMDQRNRRRK